MKIKHILLVALSATLFSCGSKDCFTIEGTLAGGEGKIVTIEEVAPKEIIPIDTIKLDEKGHFVFEYEMPYQSFYNVKVSDADFVMLLPENGETIALTGEYNRFSPTYQVEGSKGSVLLWQLNDYSLYGTKRLDSIITAFNDLCRSCNGDTNCIKKRKPALDSVFKQAFSEQQTYVVNFLERNKGSLATLIALYKMYNGNPLINPQTEDFAFYEEVADALEKTMPDNKHTIDFRNTVEKMRFQRNQQMEKAPQVVVSQGNVE